MLVNRKAIAETITSAAQLIDMCKADSKHFDYQMIHFIKEEVIVETILTLIDPEFEIDLSILELFEYCLTNLIDYNKLFRIEEPENESDTRIVFQEFLINSINAIFKLVDTFNHIEADFKARVEAYVRKHLNIAPENQLELSFAEQVRISTEVIDYETYNSIITSTLHFSALTEKFLKILNNVRFCLNETAFEECLGNTRDNLRELIDKFNTILARSDLMSVITINHENFNLPRAVDIFIEYNKMNLYMFDPHNCAVAFKTIINLEIDISTVTTIIFNIIQRDLTLDQVADRDILNEVGVAFMHVIEKTHNTDELKQIDRDIERITSSIDYKEKSLSLIHDEARINTVRDKINEMNSERASMQERRDAVELQARANSYELIIKFIVSVSEFNTNITLPELKLIEFLNSNELIQDFVQFAITAAEASRNTLFRIAKYMYAIDSNIDVTTVIDTSNSLSVFIGIVYCLIANDYDVFNLEDINAIEFICNTENMVHGSHQWIDLLFKMICKKPYKFNESAVFTVISRDDFVMSNTESLRIYISKVSKQFKKFLKAQREDESIRRFELPHGFFFAWLVIKNIHDFDTEVIDFMNILMYYRKAHLDAEIYSSEEIEAFENQLKFFDVKFEEESKSITTEYSTIMNENKEASDDYEEENSQATENKALKPNPRCTFKNAFRELYEIFKELRDETDEEREVREHEEAIQMQQRDEQKLAEIREFEEAIKCFSEADKAKAINERSKNEHQRMLKEEPERVNFINIRNYLVNAINSLERTDPGIFSRALSERVVALHETIGSAIEAIDAIITNAEQYYRLSKFEQYNTREDYKEMQRDLYKRLNELQKLANGINSDVETEAKSTRHFSSSILSNVVRNIVNAYNEAKKFNETASISRLNELIQKMF